MGVIARHQKPIRVVQRTLDPLVAVLALWTFCASYDVAFDLAYDLFALVAALVVALTFGALQVYAPWRVAPLGEGAQRIAGAWMVTAGILLVIGYATKTSALFSRRVLLTWMIVVPVALIGVHLAVRLLLRHIRQRGMNSRTYVIVGGGDLGRRVHNRIAANPWLGMRALGFFGDPESDDGALPLPRLGGFREVAAFVRTHSPNTVYLALPMTSEGIIRELTDSLEDSTASLYLVPDIFTFQLLNARLEHIDGVPVIGLRESPFDGFDGWLKRAEDVVLASTILVLISPLIAAVAVAVKLSSPGPVIFKQRRYGLDGRAIRVYKFRTMSVCEDGESIQQAAAADPRVTRIGAFLRRTSLDELPQFVNVLQGKMSIVGPRPHAVAHNEEYRRRIRGYMLRHKVRPGITGLAQVNGFRGETDTLDKMEKRVEYDLRYIQSWSLQLDLKIIGQTIFRGFVGKNAY
jgi:putative colanic acid biosynthesis UDP-glucose lipid carrier transferase